MRTGRGVGLHEMIGAAVGLPGCTDGSGVGLGGALLGRRFIEQFVEFKFIQWSSGSASGRCCSLRWSYHRSVYICEWRKFS